MRWLRRGLGAMLLGVLALLSPVAFIETACRGTAGDDDFQAVLPAEHRRAESRSLLTYPEWHIVHAYDDYARVIATGDPHEYSFLRAIGGFWSALCPLRRQAADHGGVGRDMLLTIHTIGVSFTAELLLKAAYEETVGRVFAALRGAEPAPLDDLSARQAADYARFLQQVPWYRWDFAADADALRAARTDALRDGERAFALGLEYRAKAAYARVIEGAVGQIGADATTMRSIVTGLDAGALARIDGVRVIGPLGDGQQIETPRYRAFTRIMERLAEAGADAQEIAGNDDILLTLTGPAPAPGALHGFERQGHGDWRSLMLVKVQDLADLLRDLPPGQQLEHIHDY